MTTIAYKNGILAADTKISGSNDHHWASCKKVAKVKGWLIGAAGSFGLTEIFMAKFDPVFITEQRAMPLGAINKDDSICALAISPKGTVYYTEENGFFGKLKIREHIAIGSGERIAMAAMAAGATSREAIKIAIKHDVCTGGTVNFVKLGR